MSQLDISISFSQLIGLLLGFYFFLYFISSIIIQYWYNKHLRLNDNEQLKKEFVEEQSSIEVIKRILKL